VEAGTFPDKAMMTVHPQRWTDNPIEWPKEFVGQNVKNVVKKWMVSRKDAKKCIKNKKSGGLHEKHIKILIFKRHYQGSKQSG